MKSNVMRTGREVLKRFFLPAIVILSLVSVLVTACKKDGAGPEEIEVWILQGRDTTLTVEAVAGPVSAVSGNEEVATVNTDGNQVKIFAHKPGSAEIRVRDNGGAERTVLKVEVQRGYSALRIAGYETVVFAADPEVKKHIEDELDKISPLPVNAVYGFNLLPEPSPLYVFPDGLDGEKITGTIVANYEDKSLTLRYNEQEFTYLFRPTSLVKEVTVSESPITQNSLVEDFTEEYQILYPDAGVTRAYRAQHLEPVR